MDNYVEQLIQRAKDTLGTSWLDQTQPDARDSVKRDRFDEMDWKVLEQDVPHIPEHIRSVNEHYDYVDEFYEDMFNLLHQGDPLLRDEQEMDERLRSHHLMSEGFLHSPEFQSLRLSTRHDLFSTAMAMISMKDEITQSFKRAAEAQAAAEASRQARQEAADALTQARQLLAQLIEVSEDPTAEDGEAEGIGTALIAALDRLADQEQAAAEAHAQSSQAAQDAAENSSKDMRAAAQQAADQAAQDEQLTRAFGVDPGQLQRMSFDERRRLMERLRNNRLAQFTKLIGQFHMVQQSESRRRVVHSPDEIVGVELGDDLTRLTAGEMLNLAEPLLEDDFWYRYTERALIQYRLEGKEKLGRGPIIVVCDESYSMTAEDVTGGTREAWSKAFALALAEQARKDGRDFHYIGFASSREQYHISFEKGKGTLDQLIEFTEHFFGGGTHYERPLRQAMDIVNAYHAEGKPKPDIVFLTDDEYGQMDEDFMNDWVTMKRATSMRCFGVAIGCSVSGALTQVADDVRSITEMTSDPRSVADVFRVL
jgi:uncharacterized protein with von Willebrand factor type A (vWA) domain